MSKRRVLVLIFIGMVVALSVTFSRRLQSRHAVVATPEPTPPSQETPEVSVTTTIFKKGAGRPEYSPDGSRIAYHSKGADALYDLFVMDANGENEHCLTCDLPQFADKHAGNASWHPAGELLVFQAEMESHLQIPLVTRLTHPGIGWFNNIWILNTRTSEAWQITDLPAKKDLLDSISLTAVLHPHFSSDGTQLSWGQSTNNSWRGWRNWELIVADFSLGAAGEPRVTNLESYMPNPENKQYYESDDFDSTGKSLLISANLEPKQSPLGMDIYAFDLETQTVTRLTASLEAWDEAAVYSPDNSRIAWLSSTGYSFSASEPGLWLLEGKADFWIMDADGTNQQQITFFNTPGSTDAALVEGKHVIPALIEWHPDGKSLIAGVVVRDGRQTTDMIIKIELQPAE